MISLSYIETLYYFDGHQLVVAADSVGTKLICVLTSEAADAATYCCVRVSGERLHRLRTGEIDLRSCLEQRESAEWFQATATGLPDSGLDATAMNGSIPADYLPDHGFALEFGADDFIAARAKELHNAFIEIELDPPESDTHKVSAHTLSAVLSRFQNVVKHAYAESQKAVGIKRKDTADAYLLDVLAFAPGSFKVQMEFRNGADLLGDSELEPALTLIEDVFHRIADPQDAINAIAPHRGHFVASLSKLLTVLSRERSNLGFSWSAPSLTRGRAARVELKGVDTFLALLSQQKELSVERMTIFGKLTKADEKHSTWRLMDEFDKKEYSGSVYEGTKLSLAGLVIDAVYRVHCEDRIEENPATGRERHTLLAIDFERVS